MAIIARDQAGFRPIGLVATSLALAFSTVFSLSSKVAADDDLVLDASPKLAQELSILSEMTNGTGTKLDEVDQQGAKLLAKYTEPKQKAEIYFCLAAIHAQSGVERPKEIVAYVNKSLVWLADPVKRTRLYIYWGDAVQVAHAGVTGSDLVTARRNAVTPYFLGLAELEKYNLPDTLPVAQAVFAFEASPKDPDYQALVKEHDAEMKAWLDAELDRELIKARSTLTGQIVYLYTRRPLATDELDGLAVQYLGSGKDAQRVVSAVNDAIKSRFGNANAPINPSAAMPSTPMSVPHGRGPTLPRRWISVGCLFLILAAAGAAVFRWRRRPA